MIFTFTKSLLFIFILFLKLQEQIAENRANLIREHLAAKDLGVWAPVLDLGLFEGHGPATPFPGENMVLLETKNSSSRDQFCWKSSMIMGGKVEGTTHRFWS